LPVVSVRRLAVRALVAVTGAAAARVALRAVAAAPASSGLVRINFRGREVTLAAGPAVAVGASVASALGAASPPAAAAALIAGGGAGAVGLYDDVMGARPEQKAAKGFAGHLAALRHGRVTSGIVKIIGVGTAGVAAAALLTADKAVPSRRAGGAAGRTADVILGAGLIAGTANLVNLLDLRPGRALKAAVLLGVPLLGGRQGGVAAGAVGAAAGILPADLDERVMLGDCGANALGAVLGVALAARTDRVGRAAILTAIAALTAASERVSFTEVIERTPGLRELDGLGRRRI
jgi:UDP-N-acetylmuramyl pentapeptide phosphotransferase/UDP-N-acetylglucosamine-1-phosphate transferase